MCVHGGFRVMWERWWWHAGREEWEEVREHTPDRNTYADETHANAAIARLRTMGVASPDW